jgi:manganese transport protein
VLGTAMSPYEVYFYSSGAVEDRWGLKDLSLNKVTSIIGYALGGFLSIALMIVAGVLFLPRGISPQFLGTPALAAEHTLGQVGLLLALVGILFAIGGAAIETSFSGAYNLAQFFGWRWGKKERPAAASRFTLSWLAIFAIALLVVMTGYGPVKLTEYAVIFSVVALPLTYLPILLVANDHAYMGAKVNGKLANVLGVLYFVVILAVAVAAIPLMLITHGGQG